MKYCYVLSFLFLAQVAVAQKHAQLLVDSLKAELYKSKQDTNKIAVLDQLSYTYSNIDPVEGIAYGIQALRLAEQLHWQKGIAMSYGDIGINYASRPTYDTALYYYQQSFKYYKRLNDKKGIAAVLANISLVYMAKANYPVALDFAFKALKTNEEIGDKNSQGIILENIGTLYSGLQNSPKTLEYYAKAYELYKSSGSKAGMARNLGNIGIVYDSKGDYDKALKNHSEALMINEGLGNKNAVQINLANIGYVHSHKRNYAEALTYQLRALDISKQLEIKSSIAVNLGNIGETYFALATDSLKNHSLTTKKDYLAKAIQYLEDAVVLCKQIEFSGPLSEFTQYLSDAYYQNADYKNAYRYYKHYTSLKDSVFSISNQVKLADLETRREVALKEKDLQLKDKQITIHNLELEKKRNERLIYIISITLLVLTIGIILRLLYFYRKSHIALSKEKQNHLLLIEAQLKRIRVQTDLLKEIAHMQAHDIRGPVASILGLIELFNFKDYSDPTNKVVIEGIAMVTKKLDSAVQEVIKRENSTR